MMFNAAVLVIVAACVSAGEAVLLATNIMARYTDPDLYVRLLAWLTAIALVIALNAFMHFGVVSPSSSSTRQDLSPRFIPTGTPHPTAAAGFPSPRASRVCRILLVPLITLLALVRGDALENGDPTDLALGILSAFAVAGPALVGCLALRYASRLWTQQAGMQDNLNTRRLELIAVEADVFELKQRATLRRQEQQRYRADFFLTNAHMQQELEAAVRSVASDPTMRLLILTTAWKIAHLEERSHCAAHTYGSATDTP